MPPLVCFTAGSSPSLCSILPFMARTRRTNRAIAWRFPILEQIFLPIDPETSFISSFGGFGRYDAGYYGYAWADAIAADMATIFEKAKSGYLDEQAGRKLRREIYEPGGSRDAAVSIEKFLDRKQSTKAFLKRIGVNRHP